MISVRGGPSYTQMKRTNMKMIKKGRIWHVRYKSQNGERMLTTKQTDLTLAKKVVEEAGIKQIEQAAQAGIMTDSAISAAVNGKKVTLKIAYIRWCHWMTTALAPRTKENNMTYFGAFARKVTSDWKVSKALTSIDVGTLSEWVNDGGKAGTRRVRLASLRSFWKWANAEGITNKNPAAITKVKTDGMTHEDQEVTKRDRIISDSDYQKLVDDIRPRRRGEGGLGMEWRDAIVLARRTGLRMGDVMNIEMACFDWDEMLLTVWTDKRDKRVQIPIHPEIVRKMHPDKDPLWAQGNTTVGGYNPRRHMFKKLRDVYNKPRSRSYLSKVFSRHAEKNGVKATFHDFRHTFATECKAKGLDMPHIASLLGHSSTKTTEVYVDEKVEPGKVINIADMLDDIRRQG